MTQFAPDTEPQPYQAAMKRIMGPDYQRLKDGRDALVNRPSQRETDKGKEDG